MKQEREYEYFHEKNAETYFSNMISCNAHKMNPSGESMRHVFTGEDGIKERNDLWENKYELKIYGETTALRDLDDKSFRGDYHLQMRAVFSGDWNSHNAPIVAARIVEQIQIKHGCAWNYTFGAIDKTPNPQYYYSPNVCLNLVAPESEVTRKAA